MNNKIIILIIIIIFLIMGVGIYFLTKKDDKKDDNFELEKIVEELKKAKVICNDNLVSLQTQIGKIKSDITTKNTSITKIKTDGIWNTEQYLNQYNVLLDKYYYIIKYFIDKFPTVAYKYKKLISTPLTFQDLNTLFDEFYNGKKHVSSFSYSTEFFKLLFKEFTNFSTVLTNLITSLTAEIANCDAGTAVANTEIANLNKQLADATAEETKYKQFFEYLNIQYNDVNTEMYSVNNTQAINDYIAWYDSVKQLLTPEQNADLILYVQYTKEYRNKYGLGPITQEPSVNEYIYAGSKPVYKLTS